MGSDTDTQAPGDSGANVPRRARWQGSKLVPTAAVVTVVVAAVTTTLMVTYSERQDGNRPAAISMSAPVGDTTASTSAECRWPRSAISDCARIQDFADSFSCR